MKHLGFIIYLKIYVKMSIDFWKKILTKINLSYSAGRQSLECGNSGNSGGISRTSLAADCKTSGR